MKCFAEETLLQSVVFATTVIAFSSGVSHSSGGIVPASTALLDRRLLTSKYPVGGPFYSIPNNFFWPSFGPPLTAAASNLPAAVVPQAPAAADPFSREQQFDLGHVGETVSGHELQHLSQETAPARLSYSALTEDDDDIVLVTTDDLSERRGIYEQDVEVNSNLYKGFTVYPAVPLDHRH